jgi:acyl-CoA synthetase (AMP-forming)/AMP-acid ligase II
MTRVYVCYGMQLMVGVCDKHHIDIDEVAVVGIPNTEYGQIVGAIVTTTVFLPSYIIHQ